METIKERAKEYMLRPATGEGIYREIEQAYIDGATEQREIDEAEFLKTHAKALKEQHDYAT